MNDIGMQVKRIRLQRGAELPDFAMELGVSPVYLSNLESGKTRTIQLEVLSKLQSELDVLQEEEENQADEAAERINRLAASLLALHTTNPHAVDYLLSLIEQGLQWVSNPQFTAGARQ